MKTKVLISIGAVVITAFSFTFASSGNKVKAVNDEKTEARTTEAKNSAPAGGFVMEERIEL